MGRYWRPKLKKIFVFRCTYPADRINYCQVDKIGEYPIDLEVFQTKESVFRAAASQFGFDGSSGQFSSYIERSKGMEFDHSSLIIPQGPGNGYVRVAFYS